MEDDILDTLRADGDFDILVGAIEAAGLEETFTALDSSLTVFAPTDSAFRGFAASFAIDTAALDDAGVVAALATIANSIEGQDGDGKALLASLLTYHVVPNLFPAEAAVAADTLSTLAGARLLATPGQIFDQDPTLEDAAFIAGRTDIAAENALIHAIDEVLVPQDLPDTAPTGTLPDLLAAVSGTPGFDDNGGDFDILLRALEDTALTGALGSGLLTLAAPTDAAFASLAATLGAEAETEEDAYTAIRDALAPLAGGNPTGPLTNILLYHLYDGALTRVDIASTVTLDPAGPVAPRPSATGLEDLEPNVTDPAFIDSASDLLASNGIVHAIDAVLLPFDIPEAIVSGSDGDDIFLIGPAARFVSGGAGADTAIFVSALDTVLDFDLVQGGFRLTIDGQTVDFSAVETIQLTDTSFVVDESETAAAVARLYDAALGRLYDIPGASFWTGAGAELSLAELANAFADSVEFAELIGADAPEEEVVTTLYQQILGRGPDADGLAFWTENIGNGTLGAGDLLFLFSESEENIAQEADLVANGVLLFA